MVEKRFVLQRNQLASKLPVWELITLGLLLDKVSNELNLSPLFNGILIGLYIFITFTSVCIYFHRKSELETKVTLVGMLTSWMKNNPPSMN